MKKNSGQISHGHHVMGHALTAMEQMELYCTAHKGSPSAIRRPHLFFRSELWIALLGPSMEEGIVGIGPTVAAALRAFDAQCFSGLRPAPKTFGQRGVPTVIPKPIQNLPQKLQILCGRRSGMFEPLERFGSSIRIEDVSANCGKIFTTALIWRCEHTNRKDS
jgi:hypothetical protein